MRAGLELDHLVEQKERLPVREDLLDLVSTKGRVHRQTLVAVVGGLLGLPSAATGLANPGKWHAFFGVICYAVLDGFQGFPQVLPAAVRVALGRADGHPARGRDLLEREAERVLQHDDPRLLGGEVGKAGAEVGPQFRQRRGPGGSAGCRADVVLERLAPAARAGAARRRGTC